VNKLLQTTEQTLQLYCILARASSTHAAHPVAKGTPASRATANQVLLFKDLYWEQVAVYVANEHLREPLGFLLHPARLILLEPFTYLCPDGLPLASVNFDDCRSRLVRVLFVQEIVLRPLVSALKGVECLPNFLVTRTRKTWKTVTHAPPSTFANVHSLLRHRLAAFQIRDEVVLVPMSIAAPKLRSSNSSAPLRIKQPNRRNNAFVFIRTQGR